MTSMTPFRWLVRLTVVAVYPAWQSWQEAARRVGSARGQAVAGAAGGGGGAVQVGTYAAFPFLKLPWQ